MPSTQRNVVLHSISFCYKDTNFNITSYPVVGAHHTQALGLQAHEIKVKATFPVFLQLFHLTEFCFLLSQRMTLIVLCLMYSPGVSFNPN